MSSLVSQVQHAEGAIFTQLTVTGYEPSSSCPSKMTHAYQTQEEEGDEDVIHRYTSMCFGNKILGVYPLDYLHYDLQETVHLIGTEKEGPNILAAKVSFVCKIFFEKKPPILELFSFGLKCRNGKGAPLMLFSFDQMEKIYGNSEDMFACIRHFYKQGQESESQTVNHGHTPNYDVGKDGKLGRGQAQYVKHTEQLLVASLARPEVVKGLAEQLKQKIRKKYPEGKYVKVYSMGVHFHSIRICCAPCEYALKGIANDKMGKKINDVWLGLYPNFVKQLSETGFLRRSTIHEFRIIIAGTASIKNHGHKEPVYLKEKVDAEEDLSAYKINCIGKEVSQNIYQTLLKNPIEASPHALERRKSKTFFTSGSKSSPEGKKVVEKVLSIKNLENRVKKEHLGDEKIDKAMKKLHLNDS